MGTGVIKAVVIASIAFILVGVGMNFAPDMLEGFDSTRGATESYQDVLNNQTTGNTNNMTVNLTMPVYSDNVNYVTSISSNESGDANATASSVTTTSLLLTSVAANTTRTWTINYLYGVVAYYTALDTVVKFGPTMIVLGFVVFVGIIGFMGIKMFGKR